MVYGSTTLATNFGRDPWHVRFWRLFLFFIPRANPDNEPLYPHVRQWYLELDDSGVPRSRDWPRCTRQALFGAPDARNYGFWTDSTQRFEQTQLTPIHAAEFLRLWDEVQSPRGERA
jgi:hypothetical protein